jgi:diphthamide synthase subunit DPH2
LERAVELVRKIAGGHLDTNCPLIVPRHTQIDTPRVHTHPADHKLALHRTVQEKAEAYDTCIAYSGTYDVQGNQIVHHVEVCTFENYVGTGLFHPEGIQLATGARVVALDPYLGTAAVVSADRFRRRRFQ